METDWQDLENEPSARLKWARMRWQEKRGMIVDASAVAPSFKLGAHAYRAYERPPGSSKHTPLTHQRAIEFGRKFGASWEWLLKGTGSPDDENTTQLTPTERRVIDALREAPEARQTAVADAIEQLLRTG